MANFSSSHCARHNIQWAQTEKTNKTAIQEQKIKCAYLPAEDGSTGANGIPEENEEPHSGEPSRIEESVSRLTPSRRDEPSSRDRSAPFGALSLRLFFAFPSQLIVFVPKSPCPPYSGEASTTPYDKNTK